MVNEQGWELFKFMINSKGGLQVGTIAQFTVTQTLQHSYKIKTL